MKLITPDYFDMEIGDRVKVVRISDYDRMVYECDGDWAHVPLGMVGIITEKYYNPNMHRTEVIVECEGNKYIFEPWNLMKTRLQLHHEV